MPRAKDHHAGLPTALTFYLAHGRMPPGPATVGAGTLEAFQLWGRWNRRDQAPTVLDELRDLWTQHRDEIQEAAEGGEPWVLRVLQSPVIEEE